jgi:hypothetical protein
MLTGGEILHAYDYRNRGYALAWITPKFDSFKVGGPSSLAKSGGGHI